MNNSKNAAIKAPNGVRRIVLERLLTRLVSSQRQQLLQPDLTQQLFQLLSSFPLLENFYK